MQNNVQSSWGRGPQVLRLLAEQGPLSVRGLNELIEPQITRRRLQEVLSRLYDRGLISKRNDWIFRGAAIYYEITADKRRWQEIADWISAGPHSLRQPWIRHAELIHSEFCAVWAEKLKRKFPNAKVLREFELSSQPEVENILLSSTREYDLRPDILVIQKKQAGQESVAVAFEIERSRKSDERLRRKLYKYATRTRLDGVVYLCDVDTIADRLMLIYRSKVIQKALRIGHYGEFFFLLSDLTFPASTHEPKLMTSGAKAIDLTTWMSLLSHTKDVDRRQAIFENPAPSC